MRVYAILTIAVWLVILTILTFLNNLAFSHKGLYGLSMILCYVYDRQQKINNFGDDCVHNCLTTIDILDARLGFRSTRGSAINFFIIVYFDQ